MAIRRVVLALGMLGGCVWQTRETVRQATFGYARPRAVALVIVDGTAPGAGANGVMPPDLAEAARFRLRETGAVELVHERRVPALPDTAGLCAIGAELTAAGTPVEQVVALSANVSFEPHVKCVLFGGTPPPDDGKSWLDRLTDDEPDSHRCNTAYDHGTSRAEATLTVVAVDGCVALRGAVEAVEARSDADDVVIAREDARSQAVAAFVATRAAPLVRSIFTAGLEVMPPAGGPRADDALELAGEGADVLRPRVSYLVRGPREGKRTVLGRIRPTAVGPGRTTVASTLRAVPELGDEVMLETHTHEWKLLPVLAAGDLSSDARSSTVLGAGLAARWAYPRRYLTAEVLYGWKTALDFDEHARRHDVGLALGARVPAGPVAPYLVGEAGVAFLPRLREGDTTYFHGKGFVGVGTGVELWLGPYVLVLDARLRRATGFAEGSAESETYRERVFQVGFGSRVTRD